MRRRERSPSIFAKRSLNRLPDLKILLQMEKKLRRVKQESKTLLKSPRHQSRS